MFKGMVLVEVILVLLIISLMFSIAFLIYRPPSSIYSFKKQLEQFLEIAHERALVTGQRVEIELSDERIDALNGSHSDTIFIPKEIKITGQSFAFNEHGNITRSQTWEIQTTRRQYFLVFYLGSGHYEFKT